MENCKLIIGQYNVTSLFSYPCGMVVYSIHGSNSREAHHLPRTCPFATHLSFCHTPVLERYQLPGYATMQHQNSSLLWKPKTSDVATSNMTRFADTIADKVEGLDSLGADWTSNYRAIHAWRSGIFAVSSGNQEARFSRKENRCWIGNGFVATGLITPRTC